MRKFALAAAMAGLLTALAVVALPVGGRQVSLQGTYLAPFAGSVLKTIEGKLSDWLSAADFGGTCDATAIQAAVTAAGTTGAVLIPSSCAAGAYTNTNSIPVLDFRGGVFLVSPKLTQTSVATDVPVTIPNTLDGNTNAAGTSSSLARADHSHALAVGPMLAATTAAGQSIPNNAFTIVVFGTVEVDSDSAYNSGTGVYTVPTGKGGHYSISCAAAWGSGFTASEPAVGLYVNGAQKRQVSIASNPTADQSMLVVSMLSVTAGQTIDCRVFQSSGVSKTLVAGASYNYFSLKRIQ